MNDGNPFVRDDVAAFLALLEQAGGPPINEVSLEEARGAYMALHQMADRPARDLAVITDLTCPGPGGDIPLRLYDSRDSRDPGPVICFYHGGGFVIGDLDTHHNLCTEIAHQMDLPVVAVDYRLAPEHPFPAPIEDCIAASRWIADSPEALGRPATGIIPIGDSAGGNATIVVSQALARQPADTPVLLQVPIFPLASDSAGSTSLEEFAEGFVLTKVAIEFFEAGYQPDKADPRAMPILGSHAGTPPSIVVTASLDPIRDSGRDYAAALAQAGIDHVFLEVAGGTHSFTNLRQAVPSYQTELERVFAAMKLMLAGNA
ncbi:alpha/beta hydrolase [Parerythrobacter jejuensis]|uniref:Alpha/beta hydrolase fold domain-containing protein n=1 Tax=Parerythrobacter jejuensis TaxID=795812 RepID=A0A845AVL9_9SPHN|nr:alpha/beta hydrolase [Parerythrobacter jejuensis]MXP32536.1 alpha/beta hydrolase fold domain-containing protein [Parerythrobacter jejuensis]